MTVALSRLNFRDLGGMRAADGRFVRHGAIYRSEGPASFLEQHRAELVELDIRLICDLRADVERAAAPNDWSASGRLLNMEISNDLRVATNEGWAALRHDPSEAGAIRAMTTNYGAMPGALQPHVGGLIKAIVDGEIPALIHCTAGKDRTGVLIGLLLALLGVAQQDIVEDYLRSDIFAKNLRLGGSISHAFEETFGFVPSEATIDAMIGVSPAYLAAAFASVRQGWGNVENYFTGAGVNAAQQQRFRDCLLTGKLK